MSLFTDDMRRDPFPTYDALRPRSPVHVPIGDLWMILDYDGVERALRDHESFGSDVAPARGVRFGWLLFLDPPRHTKLRALLGKAFTPRSVAALEPRIRDLARAMLAPLLSRGTMDMASDFAVPLPMMVIAEMLGLPVDEWPRLHRWSEAIINLGATIAGNAAEADAASRAFLAANDEMTAYLGEHTARRRSGPRDDLIGRARAHAARAGAVAVGDRGGAAPSLAGADDVSRHAAADRARRADHPRRQIRARDDRRGQPRSGIHFCIGAPLSRLEARVALGELLPTLRELERASDEPWQPRAAFQVHGPTSLPIRFAPAALTDATSR